MTGREEHHLGEDRGNPEAFAHMAINAGASLLIASGPHVLRGMRFYKLPLGRATEAAIAPASMPRSAPGTAITPAAHPGRHPHSTATAGG